jgi:hypothetical protein
MRAAIFILALFLVGCNPCKRLVKKCPPVIRDSIIETVEFDTITLVSPADTLWLEIPVEMDLNDLFINNEVTDGPSVEIKIDEGLMKVEVICPEDSLKAIIAELEKKHVQTIEVKVPVYEKHIPGFYKWCRNVLIILVVLLAGYIYIRIKGGSIGKRLKI